MKNIRFKIKNQLKLIICLKDTNLYQNNQPNSKKKKILEINLYHYSQTHLSFGIERF